MQGRGRRILFLVAAAVAVWYLIVIFSWAARPLNDAIPIGADPSGKPVSKTVECNTLFSSAASAGTLPVLATKLPLFGDQYVYNRPACDLVQRDARIVFGLDTIGAIIVIGGLLFVALRSPTEAAPVLQADRTSYA